MARSQENDSFKNPLCNTLLSVQSLKKKCIVVSMSVSGLHTRMRACHLKRACKLCINVQTASKLFVTDRFLCYALSFKVFFFYTLMANSLGIKLTDIMFR